MRSVMIIKNMMIVATYLVPFILYPEIAFRLMTKMMIMTSPFNSSEKMISGMTEFSKAI